MVALKLDNAECLKTKERVKIIWFSSLAKL